MKCIEVLPMRIAAAICLVTISMPLEAGRPLNTDDTGTTAPGQSQLETGYGHARYKNQDNERELCSTFYAGLTEKMDLEITVPQAIEPEHGLDASAVAVKCLLLKGEGKHPSFAFTFTSSSGSSEYFLNGICTQNLGPCALHLNLGYLATGVVGARGQVTYSSAIEYPLNDKITLVGELFGGSVWGETNPLSAQGGGSYALSDKLALDLGIGWGLTNVDADWTINTGFTLGF
jgi:hypothetical protein